MAVNENTGNLVNRYMTLGEDNDEGTEIVMEIAANIENDETSLVQLVQLLGEYLTKEDGIIRGKATKCLGRTLGKLARDKLTKQQLGVVNEFLCDRIEDEDCLGEVLEGLIAIVQMDVFSVMGVEKIVEGLKEGVNMKKNVQNVRYLVFDLFDVILERFESSGRLNEEKFVEAYVYLTNGEKDPRNLLKSFKICRKILMGFKREELDKYKDELFDVVFCYFPITFEPPKNDPYGISKKDLKDGLRDSLIANDIFSKEVFPSLIEKLNSTAVGVKEDSLEMMRICIKKYSGDSLRKDDLWKEIWDGIKYEVLHGSDDGEISELALSVLIELTRKVGSYEKNDIEREEKKEGVEVGYHLEDKEIPSESPLEALLSQVKKETKEKLEEPQSKLAIPAGNLVSGISQASIIAFESLSSFAIPILLSSVSSSATIDRQVGVLTIISKFLIASGNVRLYEDSEKVGDDESKQEKLTELRPIYSSLLTPFKDEIFELFSRSLNSSKSEIKLRLLAIDGFTLLTQLSNLLANDEIGLIIQYFNSILLTDDDEEITERTINSLVKLIKSGKQDQILNITFPSLLSSLPDSYDKNTTTLQIQKPIEFILLTLSKLSITKSTFEILTIRLLNKLEVITNENDNSNRYVLLLLLTILSSLHKLPNEDLTNYFDKFISKFIKLILNPRFQNDNQIIDTISQIVSFIVKNLSIEKQTEYANNLISLFETGVNHSLLIPNSSSTPLHLLSYDSPPSNLISFFTITLAPIDKSINLPLNPIDIITNSIHILEQSKSVYERSGYLRLISLLTNKYITTDDLLIPIITSLTSSTSLTSLESLAWLGKGLILRNNQLGYKITDSIVENLNDEHSAKYAARMIAVLIAPDSVLSKENGLIVRQLYKQKLFSSVIPKLIEGFKSNLTNRVNYMTSLSGLLQFTPSSIITPQLPKFLPLLLESFNVQDSKVQEAAINTIIVTLHEASDIFSHHTSTMVHKLLALSQDRDNNPPSVRSAALSCLGAFPKSIAPEFLLPYRNSIIKGLEISLDDPKRSVRTDAVLCRQSYYELGI